MTFPPFQREVPTPLCDLETVVAATLSSKGDLVDANEGFRNLLDVHGDRNVRACFYQPDFDDLVSGDEEGWTLVHEGQMTVGPVEDGDPTTLLGTVHRRGDQLVLLAERDLEGEEKLREKVMELNEELGETQREMVGELRARRRIEKRLEQKAENLERSNELLEEFAYVVSHDLQEPLRMVQSYLELLEERYGADLDDEAREFVDYAVGGAHRMEEMIEGLLSYSRVESQREEPDEVDLDAVVDDVLDNLGVRVDETDATVDVGELGTVVGDRSQLVHLFQNLVDNALKYSGDDPPQVEVTAEAPADGKRTVHVADRGIGIPPARQEEVFGIFKRGEDPPEEGTGVGLAVCRRIVERHGGDLELESTPGEGSVFSFTLPTPDEDDIDGTSES